MRRALRRAALALLAAGTSGLTGPAVAQSLPPAAPMALPPADTAREGRWRLEEIKVEIAWLADAATFPYVLAARTVDGNLEIRGTVPDSQVQAAVLKIARAHTHLNVVDALEIGGAAAHVEAGVSAAAVRQGAVEILNDSFGMAARGFEIRAEGEGQVSVGGSVNSVEEKLAVSRRLRKVRGCTNVANYILISPVMRDGRMVTQINAAGTLVVPGQVLCLDGTGQDSSGTQPPVVAARTAPPSRTVVTIPKANPPALMALQASPLPPAPPVMVNRTPVAPPVRPAVGQAPAAQPVMVQPAQMQVPAGAAAAYPIVPSRTPARVMPIEIPEPPAPMPTPRPTTTSAAPAPAIIQSRLDLPAPGTLPAPPQTQVTPPAPGALPVLKPATVTKSGKDVDLLSVPVVPPSWTRDKLTPPAPKPLPKSGPTSFATARTDAPKQLSADELLALPVVPLTQPAKPHADVPAPSTTISKPVSVPAPSASSGLVVPAAPAPPKVVPPAIVVPSKPIVPAPVPAAASAATAKPLPMPAPTAFQEKWVESLPAPTPAPTSGHPLPPSGGWPAAHVTRQAASAYVTSGVVVFPDDNDTSAKPAPVAATRPTAAKPDAQLVSRVEPSVHAPATAAGVVQPSPYATAAVPLAASRLKAQVERACGRLVSHVEVVTADGGLTVRVKCADAATAQKVTDRVLVQVPEMADARVKFEVNVGP